MTVEKIDFYILADLAPGSENLFACRLTERAYNTGLHIHIQTPNPTVTEHLDGLLWTFSQQSFIPHQQTSQADELCAVTLNHDWQPHNRGLLINLSSDIPAYFEEFTRIAEVVGANEERIQIAREHFRFYQSKGYQPQHHKVS